MDEDYARRLRDWLRAEPETAESRWLREIPDPNETREQDPADRWSVQGQLPHVEATPDDDGGLAVVIPLPRPSRENGCRLSGPRPRTRPMSEAEARSRRNHPSNVDRREEAAEPQTPQSPMSEAEARSRWNHPANWHRRRRAAEQQPREEPGSR